MPKRSADTAGDYKSTTRATCFNSAELTPPFGIEEKPLNARRRERRWVLLVQILPNGAASITYSLGQ